ncbi:MAG: hypothetical protein WD512_14195 [Candidatus Paceibacterota bacterium]
MEKEKAILKIIKLAVEQSETILSGTSVWKGEESMSAFKARIDLIEYYAKELKNLIG